MFSKASKLTDGRADETRRSTVVPSILGPDLRISGNLVSPGEIQVDGQIEGDVTAATLTIGDSGRVQGTVTADDVKVRGRVAGEIRAGSVTLAATARVEGDIVHDSLAVEPGAHFEGRCRRRNRSAGAVPTAGVRSDSKSESRNGASGSTPSNGNLSGGASAESRTA